MKTSLQSISIVFLIAFSFMACKKDTQPEPTPEPIPTSTQKPAQAPVVENVLCDGKAGNTSYFPLAVGNKWTYSYNYYSSAPDIKDTIVGTEVINGVTYFKVSHNDGYSGSENRFLRIDDTSKNVYLYDFSSSSEKLIIPGNPTVGQNIGRNPIGAGGERTINSITATTKTKSCTYTNCIEIRESSNGAFLGFSYFKQGIGYITGTDFYLKSVTIK